MAEQQLADNTKMTAAVLRHFPESRRLGCMKNTRRDFLMQSALAAGAAGRLRGQTAPLDIFQAAADGNSARAIELLTADPQLVRSRSADGRTPLHFATAAGKSDMVTLLATRGAELSAGPESPLLGAVDFADHGAAADMTQFLAGNGSDPNARRKDGKSALELARARGYGDVAEILIHRGAASDDRKVERVHFARRFNKSLTTDVPWLEVNPFVSIAHANFDRVKELLAGNSKLLNTRASWDETAIEAAAHTGHLDMAQWLAEKGAAVSTCTAVLLGTGALVKEALAADRLVVNERGAHDISILGYTAYANEQPAIADMLLKAGANVQAKALGVTALHLAAQKGYVELAEVLLSHGADVNAAVKSRGQMVTPLAVAMKADQKKMADLLRSKGAE
jgi:ankyrin repeat protein